MRSAVLLHHDGLTVGVGCGTDAARAFVLMLRESLNKAASEGNGSSADLYKQWASRKKLAKMFVVSASAIPGSFLH
jgi:hypothetical protein